MKDHEHDYKLEKIDEQYSSSPGGTGGTGTIKEYAYLMCKKCFKFIKKEVEDNSI